jgi:hypothetical protein
MNLPIFPDAPTQSAAELAHCLLSPRVRRVVNFALGPEGTNIAQASAFWTRKMGICGKAETVLCKTPEKSLEKARLVTVEGIVPIFWTCAVYFKLNVFFFSNPDIFPFLFVVNMPLDAMQLCARAELRGQEIAPGWKIASHASPAPLIAGLPNLVVEADSNAHAAIKCASGETEACITTAQAAALHKLYTLHEFGSPIMVFFGGTTRHGINVLLGQ